MKPRNFPGRKFQRQEAADRRNDGVDGVKSSEIKVPTDIRNIRTKKKRG